jgi:AraC family transcriptional regulator, regulatory protein of adaptative response / DNA-3-methyladenine glycosylase II
MNYSGCVGDLTLDWRVCARARLSRDARFDGKFFIGVRGSGVYCRSICPAPTAKEENCRYFPTAAAAAEAGFRPCLRCRPECSPGTPAWLGTSNTVARALRLISETGLEEGGVEKLAEKLGVGSRHLRRLFLKHLGASPSAVAHTRRLHFAKKLLDETSLPMSHVAQASGFGCVRRFNAAIRNTYKRTPSQIRRRARQPVDIPDNEYFFRMRFRPPYEWDIVLAFLALRATPGVEFVEDGTYRRTISLNGSDGHFEVSLDRPNNSLVVRIQIGDPRSLFTIVEGIRRMFDVNADWQTVASRLRTDPALRQRIDKSPGLRVPGCWDGFELAARAILGQQVTVKGATTLAGRLVQSFGRTVACNHGLSHVFPSPQVLASARLTRIGLPAARAETISRLARAVCDGQIHFGGVTDTEMFLQRLLQTPGIGKWTAQYIAMRALGEPDAFPSSDLGLLRALALKDARELEARSQHWRPWRAYAAMYLWNVTESSHRGPGIATPHKCKRSA